MRNFWSIFKLQFRNNFLLRWNKKAGSKMWILVIAGIIVLYALSREKHRFTVIAMFAHKFFKLKRRLRVQTRHRLVEHPKFGIVYKRAYYAYFFLYGAILGSC